MTKTFVLVVFCLPCIGLAADSCETWGCVSTISTLYTNVNGVVYIGTPLDEKKANCTPVSGVYFTLNPSNSNNFQAVYSNLLGAYLQNKKIRLRIKERSPNCELEYVVLDVSF
ncbi:hypothetical protein TI05_00885 [Achromatium sp. WMS3]|nr:hypothetical protein TI05_00885 [Achromatium sp. WMS3]